MSETIELCHESNEKEEGNNPRETLPTTDTRRKNSNDCISVNMTEDEVLKPNMNKNECQKYHADQTETVTDAEMWTDGINIINKELEGSPFNTRIRLDGSYTDTEVRLSGSDMCTETRTGNGLYAAASPDHTSMSFSKSSLSSSGNDGQHDNLTTGLKEENKLQTIELNIVSTKDLSLGECHRISHVPAEDELHRNTNSGTCDQTLTVNAGETEKDPEIAVKQLPKELLTLIGDERKFNLTSNRPEGFQNLVKKTVYNTVMLLTSSRQSGALKDVSESPGLSDEVLTNTPTEELCSFQTLAIEHAQIYAKQMMPNIIITHAEKCKTLPSRMPFRSRPPKFSRHNTLSTVRTRLLPHGPSLYYEKPKPPHKVITWDAAFNSRPPLRIDMEGPTPCTYSPTIKPLNETNAPAFTFGSRCYPEKSGGSRTAWSKSYFQSPHVWLTKADFTDEGEWPSPNQYLKVSSNLGSRQNTMPEAPSYTFGYRTSYSVIKPDAANDPAPNEYRRHLADRIIMRRSPAFTHQFRHNGTVLWGGKEITPGPAAYSPILKSREHPSFTIQGIRREKSYLLGPYSSL